MKVEKIDPERRGREVAALFLEHAPRLFADLMDSDIGARVGEAEVDASSRADVSSRADATSASIAPARREWSVFALYACVRGLVAAGGFNRETAAAIDMLHEQVAAAHDDEGESLEAWRARVSERYEEYGAIGQEGGKSGAATVTQRLGEAAARHMTGGEPDPDVAEMVGALHEALAESIAERLRGAG